MAAPQSFKKHVRWDPLFHFVIMPFLLFNFVASIVYYVRHFPLYVHVGLWVILLSIVLLLMASKIRSYSLKVQNRVIRLEERVRLAALASPGEMAELESVTIDQYVALRFASNPELPALARRAIREKLTPKQIKEAIVAWRADDYRV